MLKSKPKPKKTKEIAKEVAKPSKYRMESIACTNQDALESALKRYEDEGVEIINVLSLNGRSFTFFLRRI